MRTTTIAAVAMLAGCSASKPASDDVSVLPTGARVVAYGDRRIMLFQGGSKTVEIDAGTTLTVGYDPGSYRETAEDLELHASVLPEDERRKAIEAGPRYYAPGTRESRWRRVKVLVESGRRKGEGGEIARFRLRLAPR